MIVITKCKKEVLDLMGYIVLDLMGPKMNSRPEGVFLMVFGSDGVTMATPSDPTILWLFGLWI